MKFTVLKPVEMEADAIRMNLPVRYGDEDIPYDFPFRSGDIWQATVDINTGKIRDWPAGKTANMCMKVTDSGVYELLSGDQVIATREDYVPICLPNDCGDYVEFVIDEDGAIQGFDRYMNRDNVSFAFFPRNEG